jgi:hypothetical protein
MKMKWPLIFQITRPHSMASFSIFFSIFPGNGTIDWKQGSNRKSWVLQRNVSFIFLSKDGNNNKVDNDLTGKIDIVEI